MEERKFYLQSNVSGFSVSDTPESTDDLCVIGKRAERTGLFDSLPDHIQYWVVISLTELYDLGDMGYVTADCEDDLMYHENRDALISNLMVGFNERKQMLYSDLNDCFDRGSYDEAVYFSSELDAMYMAVKDIIGKTFTEWVLE